MEASTPQSVGPTSTEHEEINIEDPNIVWFAGECRRNHVKIEALVGHAERIRDLDLAAFFRRAQAVTHKLASA
jgi:hypothetical protein